MQLFDQYSTALICIDPSTFNSLKAQNKYTEIEDLTGEIALLQPPVVLAGAFGIGAPAAVAFLEELVACGIKKFIFLGTAGRLTEGFHKGDILICEKAFSDEGTSKHYSNDIEYYSSNELNNQIENFLADKGNNINKCIAWTTDAPYRESTEKLGHFLKQGAQVVEMEAAALFTVAKHHGVELSLILIISDSIANGQWQPYFKSDVVKEKQNSTATLLLDFLNNRD
jgi:uridine phosphorylase